MSKVKIFLTNLGKYNEGELVGEWIDLPVDDDFEQAFKDIGISDEPDEDGNYYEEYFITDYEAPFSIDEYENIFELNEKAERLEELSDDEMEILEAICEEGGYDFDEAFDVVSDGDYNVWYCDGSDYDLGAEVIDELGYPNDADYYFDYESFGRDLRLDGYFDSVIQDYRDQGDDEYADEYEEEIENMSDEELGYDFVDSIGGIEELGNDALETYFDYDEFGRVLRINGTFYPFDEGFIEVY
jgi:antirestriction protein